MVENQRNQLIQHATVAPDSVIQLLKSTLIGTEGSLYQLLDTEEKIKRLDRPHFFFLERHQKAVGTMTICERSVMLNKQPVNALYIRYFAFDSILQGTGNKKKITRNSALDGYIKNLFDKGNLSQNSSEKKRTFFWAYIDPQNLRSFNMNERFAFETVGSFRTISFSRFFPKMNDSVCRLKKEEQSIVLSEIKKFYNQYSLFCDAHLFEQDNFFVYKHEGKIVAGIQADPSKFRIVSLPGLSGKILIKLLPYIPLMRKIINPKQHRFLATEGIFWLDGHADKVEKLLSGVLAITNHHSLLIWEDNQSTKVKNLPLKWGLLQRIKKDNEIKIVAKFVNTDAITISTLKAAPKYLSGFDMT